MGFVKTDSTVEVEDIMQDLECQNSYLGWKSFLKAMVIQSIQFGHSVVSNSL